MRLIKGESGQFVPIAWSVVLAGVMLIIASANVYRVTKAKLQAQNMADAAALAVAALEAKEINVVVDRDEWMNHMYSTDDPTNKNRLPNISVAANGNPRWQAQDSNMAQYYAQLVATINKAQSMFMSAYENFYGVNQGQGGTQSQNAGPGGLQDILNEISGLNDPSVTVMIYNMGNQDPQGAAQQARGLAANQGNSTTAPAGSNIYAFNMPVPIKPVPVYIDIKGGKNNQSLKQVLNLPDSDPDIGWMRPVWDDPTVSMKVNTGSGQSTSAIGATAIVVKRVSLTIPPLQRSIYVTAHATAYVDKTTGQSVKTGTTATVGGNPSAPDHFRPTYFVRLGAPSQ